MSEKFFHELPYSKEEAEDEAKILTEKVESGKTYEKASEQIDNENLPRFSKEWDRNAQEIYNENFRILTELVEGIEQDLENKGVFDFTNPDFWSELAQSDLKHSAVIAQKYKIRTDEFGSVGFRTELVNTVGRNAFVGQLFVRDFFHNAVEAGVTKVEEKQLFLRALANIPAENSAPYLWRNKLGLTCLEDKLKALHELSQNENAKEISDIVEKRLGVFIKLMRGRGNKDFGYILEALPELPRDDARKLDEAIRVFFANRHKLRKEQGRGKKYFPDVPNAYDYEPTDNLAHEMLKIGDSIYPYRSWEQNEPKEDLITNVTKSTEQAIGIIKKYLSETKKF